MRRRARGRAARDRRAGSRVRRASFAMPRLTAFRRRRSSIVASRERPSSRRPSVVVAVARVVDGVDDDARRKRLDRALRSGEAGAGSRRGRSPPSRSLPPAVSVTTSAAAGARARSASTPCVVLPSRVRSTSSRPSCARAATPLRHRTRRCSRRSRCCPRERDRRASRADRRMCWRSGRCARVGNRAAAGCFPDPPVELEGFDPDARGGPCH